MSPKAIPGFVPSLCRRHRAEAPATQPQLLLEELLLEELLFVELLLEELLLEEPLPDEPPDPVILITYQVPPKPCAPCPVA
jgi:hypothetical protein